MQVASLKIKWRKAGLTPVFYHTTFIDNALLLIKDRKLSANRGNSICRSKNGSVSLSDRITKGIVEFFGNVVFEFDALSLYERNQSIAPRDYGIAEDDIERYDELPFFENEWRIPKVVAFELNDINKVLLITSKDFQESVFEPVTALLEGAKISYCFLSEKWLPDKINSDTARYFLRLENWKNFIDATLQNRLRFRAYRRPAPGGGQAGGGAGARI